MPPNLRYLKNKVAEPDQVQAWRHVSFSARTPVNGYKAGSRMMGLRTAATRMRASPVQLAGRSIWSIRRPVRYWAPMKRPTDQPHLPPGSVPADTQMDRDRGKSRDSSPPTPPDVRVRIRRFGGLSRPRHRDGSQAKGPQGASG